MNMNYVACILIVFLSPSISGMEDIKANPFIVTMPSKKVLKDIFEDTSLSKLAEHSKVEAFYDLADKNIEVEVLRSILEGFYNDFIFLRLISNIPEKLVCQNMGQVISMEYAYLAKELFKSTPNYWHTIEHEFVNKVHVEGHKKFKFLNIKKLFYGSKIKKE